MLTLSTEIEKHIKKLINPLKNEEELLNALKLKLTKKELKLLKYWAENADIKIIQTEISRKLIKKLNQEKTKQAICI